MSNQTAQLRAHRCAYRYFNTIVVAAATLTLWGASAATAAPILFQGGTGSLNAEVGFQVDGTALVVTLKNTSLADVTAPNQVLTGVFFDLTPATAISLTPVSAILPADAAVVFGGTDAGNSVGGEWAVRSDLSDGPGNRQYGISSAGLGIFGSADRFPGSNLQGPESPDGLQYGITSAGDNIDVGNSAVTGSNALIKNSVVFRLGGLPADFSPLTAISNVWFQYGTNLNEGGYIGKVPDPASLMLLVAGIPALLSRRKR